MTDSILYTIKDYLGASRDDASFDSAILMTLNSVIGFLVQIGIGTAGFIVTSENEIWSDLCSDEANIPYMKMYVCLKTKLIFDPPTNATLLKSMEELIKEAEWRLNIDT